MLGRVFFLPAFLLLAGCVHVAASRAPLPPPVAERNIADVDVFVEPLPGLLQAADSVRQVRDQRHGGDHPGG